MNNLCYMFNLNVDTVEVQEITYSKNDIKIKGLKCTK